MSDSSRIEWTDSTWNPVTGCTKISAGCKYCYAEVMARRLKAMGQSRYSNGFELTLQHDVLEKPLSWKTPRMVFVNSMSDLFHEDVPLAYIRLVFKTMRQAHWHTFQILTKRSERLRHVGLRLDWPDNVWMGVSVENARYMDRICDLRRVPANIRFLSLEPLLGPLVNLPLNGIHWVIAGGESGSNPRPVEAAWIRSIKEQCMVAGVPFFFKQWGGRNKKKAGRLLDGRTWDEMPTTAAISLNGRLQAPASHTLLKGECRSVGRDSRPNCAASGFERTG